MHCMGYRHYIDDFEGFIYLSSFSPTSLCRTNGVEHNITVLNQNEWKVLLVLRRLYFHEK